ncbi:DEAD/DEAH box helicase, partial [Haematococcus lacustris]
PGGAILVLLPGWQDIEWLRALLTCGPETWGKLFGSQQQQVGDSGDILSSGSYGDSGDIGRQSAQTGESSAQPQAQGQASPQPVEGMWVLPCHSSLTREEQQRVFDSAPQETSITIPDVTAVVDSGRRRQVGYDPLNKTKSLTQGWISQSSAEQR